MSYNHYFQSIRIVSGDELGGEPDFYSIIMAAMRRADSDNLEKLQSAFPRQAEELQVRYNAPGGYVSKDEARVYSEGLSDEVIDQIPFPKEGWPYGS